MFAAQVDLVRAQESPYLGVQIRFVFWRIGTKHPSYSRIEQLAESVHQKRYRILHILTIRDQAEQRIARDYGVQVIVFISHALHGKHHLVPVPLAQLHYQSKSLELTPAVRQVIHDIGELHLRRAGVPWENLFRDVGVSGSTGTQERRGWHRLNGRLAGGDTLVVVAIDRIGRRWPDILKAICSLRDRGVKIRSLAEAEAEWTQYLEADEGSPEAFFGQILTMFAAWVADPGRARAGPPAGEGPRASPEGRPRATGGDAAKARRRRQPPEDRQRLRVLTQHSPEGPSTGGSGIMTNEEKTLLIAYLVDAGEFDSEGDLEAQFRDWYHVWEGQVSGEVHYKAILEVARVRKRRFEEGRMVGLSEGAD